MKRLSSLFGTLLGLLALAALVMVLVTTRQTLPKGPQPASQGLQSPIQPPTPPRATPTPPPATPTPPRATPTPALPVVPWPIAPPYTPPPGWTHITLDQIEFGDPTVVFTTTRPLKILQWLPDNRRLLLEFGVGDADIVTLDTTRGEVTYYASRPENDLAPVWVNKVNGIVYQFCPSNRPCEVRFVRAGQKPRTLSQGGTRLAVHQPSGRVLVAGPQTPLLAVDLVEGRRVAPPVLLTPAPERAPFFIGRWSDYVSVDPRGRWLAHIWGNVDGVHIDITNITTGRAHPVRIWDEEMEMLSGEGGFKWRPGASVWSPGGRYLAVIVEGWVNLLMTSKIAVIEPESGTWHWLDIPSRFVDEIDWAPDERHMLVKAGHERDDNGNMMPNAFWLIDTETTNVRRFNSFRIKYPTSGGAFMAWSPNGMKIAWIRNVSRGIGILTARFVTQR